MTKQEVKSVYETKPNVFNEVVNTLLEKGWKLHSSNSSYQPETENTTHWPVFTAILVRNYDDGVVPNF